MACFDYFIVVDELCSDPIPTSGLRLNDIGISKFEIEQINTKDFGTVENFVNKKLEFAIKQVTSEIYSYVSPMFKADSILAGNRVGYPDRTKELINQSGYVGVEVQLDNPGSFVDFVISDISVYTDYTGTIPVLIYDLDQGLLLQTINVTSVAGQISVSYDKAVISAPRKALNLWIGYDATAINSYKTITHNGCSDCRGYTFNHRYLSASGAAIVAPFVDAGITSLTHTGGISFNYSINCNHTDWICNHRNILAIPVLWKVGVEIANHALLAAPNQRTMAITTVNTELMEKKLAYFNTEYRNSMDRILKNMAVPEDRNCFHCNQRIISRTTLA